MLSFRVLVRQLAARQLIEMSVHMYHTAVLLPQGCKLSPYTLKTGVRFGGVFVTNNYLSCTFFIALTQDARYFQFMKCVHY